MKNNRPSNTALGVSVVRTVHQLIDSRPLILDDPISPLLLSRETIEGIQENPTHHQTLEARGLRSHVVLRSRYAEDQMQQAIPSGIAQFVNVGAGFDTFCLRQPQWAENLRIIEVDHPATQAAKREYFSARGLSFPENTDFVPLDLEKGDLFEELAKGRIVLNAPTFFSCLGVLAYLSLAAIEKVLRSVAGMAAGSRLVLAFAPKSSDVTTEGQSTAAERAAEQGEPWLTYFTMQEIEGMLRESGFSAVYFLTPGEAAERYYRGRTDLPAPRRTRLCLAEV